MTVTANNLFALCLQHICNDRFKCYPWVLFQQSHIWLQAISLPVTVSKSGKVNKEILLPMMVKALPFNSSNMYTNCEVKGTRSVREHGSVNEVECHSPSAMISSSETSSKASKIGLVCNAC